MQAFNPNQISVPTGHAINGSLIGDAGAETIVMRHPSDSQVYAQLPLADEVLVDRAVETS